MKAFYNDEVDAINLDESGIVSIRWINEEKDLILDIDWGGQIEFAHIYDFNSLNSSLHFEFVTDLEMDFKFLNGNMGGLEISRFNYHFKQEVWDIQITFTFQPKGYISFKCNKFKFVIEDSKRIS